MAVILKRVLRVGLMEEVVFERRLKRGKRVSLADTGERMVQVERAAGAIACDRRSLVTQKHSQEAMWLEWKEKRG